MTKQPRVDVFITSYAYLECYLEEEYMDGLDLVVRLTGGIRREGILKHEIPHSCCVVVRQTEEGIKHYYSLAYSAGKTEPLKKMRLPESESVSIDELSAILKNGLESIASGFKTQNNKDFILACKEEDCTTVSRTLGNLGYHVVQHYTKL